MRWIAALYASLRTVIIGTLATSGGTQAQQALDSDDATWEAARRENTVEAWQGYLEQFPVGRHVEEAFRGMVEQQTDIDFGASRGVTADMY
jgi:hypothetical protein